MPCARRLTTRHRAGHRHSHATRASSHKTIDPRWSRPLAWSFGSGRLRVFIDPGRSDRRCFSLVRRQVRWCFSAMGTAPHAPSRWPSAISRDARFVAQTIDPRWSRPLAWLLGSRRLGGFVDPGRSDRRFFPLVRRQVRWCFSAMGTAPHAPWRWPSAISRGARLATHNNRTPLGSTSHVVPDSSTRSFDLGRDDCRILSLACHQVRWRFSAMCTAPHDAPSCWPSAF